LTAELDKKKRV